MEKAIVTGGAGFIGSHLVDLLIARGLQVTVIDNLSTGRLQNLAHVAKDLTFIEQDISKSLAPLKDVFLEANYIFHLAALADIVPSIKYPEVYYQANVLGTQNVINMCKGSKNLKKFFYASSASCYGLPEKFPTREDAQIKLEYPYALTKRLGEETVLHWGKVYKIPVCSGRFFNAYGPRSRTSGTYGAVFGVFLAQKLANKPYTIVGDGEQTRDFTYVQDIVEAIWEISQSSQEQEIYNIGSGGTYSINYLCELLKGEKIFIPKRPGEPECTYADITKIKQHIGWEPRFTFEDGVKEVLKNIDYWKDAPVWSPESIANETKEWFESLS